MFGKTKREINELRLMLNDRDAFNTRLLDSAKENFKYKIAELETQNKKLEDRIWLLENPPKYKVGQVVKGMIVTSVEVVDGGLISKKATLSGMLYLFGGDAEKQKHWQYKAIKKGMTEPIEIL